jgi:hypothetical protein
VREQAAMLADANGPRDVRSNSGDRVRSV